MTTPTTPSDPLAQTAAALPRTLAPAIVGLAARRRAPPSGAGAAIDHDQDAAGARLTLAFIEQERATGALQASLTASLAVLATRQKSNEDQVQALDRRLLELRQEQTTAENRVAELVEGRRRLVLCDCSR